MSRFVHTMPFGSELTPDGVRFRLWAPAKDRVDVVVDNVVHAMEPRADGWFEALVGHASAGSRYAFRFPGSDLHVPDPASRFQPEGAHGRSAVVDPSAYLWKHADRAAHPWHELVLYELHIGTFTPEGTYEAAAARLAELVEVGVTAIELMPLAQPAGPRNWGYDGVLPFAPQQAYGNPDELKAFIDAAHEQHLDVFLDVVYNHFGPEGNYLHAYAAAFFNERHHTPWGAAINYDGRDARFVREFVVQNALYWLSEYRFDGLRFDAVHEIHDDSTPHLLEEIGTRVRTALPPERRVHLVLENDANEAHLLAHYDAQWNDDAHHAFHVLLTGEHDGYYRDYADDPARMLARTLAEGFAYQGEPSRHRGGRRRGEPSAGLAPTKFVDFLQNHDQIGNRAFGERISALAPHEAVKAAAAVFLLAPAIPLLFMGEEWAASTPFLFFASFGRELATAVTEGRRKEFAAWPAFADPTARERIPDPQDPETMRASTLDWDERTFREHREMLEHYQRLLALRHGVVVPRLAHGVSSDGYEVLGKRTIRVRWRFGDRSQLSLVAHLGPHHERASYVVAGTPLYTLGDVPTRADKVALSPWSVGWFLAT